MADTLQEGAKNIHFTPPTLQSKGFVVHYMNHPVMDSINSAIKILTGMPNIDVEFIKSMQFNDQEFIINEVMITVNGKHYRFAIE